MSASQQVTAPATTAPPTTSTGAAGAAVTSDLDLSKESADLLDMDALEATLDKVVSYD